MIESTPARQPIMMTLDDWREIAGHIASEANDAADKKLQKKLDAIFSKVQELLDSHAVDDGSHFLRRSGSHLQRSRSNSPNGLRRC